MAPKGLLFLLFVWLSGASAFAAKEVPLEILHSFSHGGWEPNNPLVRSDDGNFYGTTRRGGVYDSGTVYRLTPEGAITIVASLPEDSFAGAEVGFSLTFAKDGQLYGVLPQGGGARATVFRVVPGGVCETITTLPSNAHSHSTPRFTGAYPRGPLLAGEDGYLYGTTERGGANDMGTLYRIASDGSLTNLADFGGGDELGKGPSGALVRMDDGTIFGTTRGGGSADSGTVFKLAADGTLSTVVHFGAEKGRTPELGLYKGRDGKFYGMTSGESSLYSGTLFSVTENGEHTVLASLKVPHKSLSDNSPGTSLAFGADGSIYGFTAVESRTGYQVFKYDSYGTLSHFVLPDQTIAAAGVTDDGSGNLLGVIGSGGAVRRGRIFRMSALGEFETAGEFTLPLSAYPTSILRAGDGTLYGSTQTGGPTHDGTLFKISPDGTFSTLAAFDKAITGSGPRRLCFGPDGLVYGLTSAERASLFRLNPDNSLSVLHSFSPITGTGAVDITLGPDGAFSVPTFLQGPYAGGTVLRITTEGIVTVVHSFSTELGQPHSPNSRLFLEPGGTFLGTLAQSGKPGAGIIYRLSLDGALTLLGSISVAPLEVRERLLHPSDGNLYATAIGYTNQSSLLRFKPSGDTDLLNWAFSEIAGSRVTGLSTASDHHMYGATGTGGPFGDGSIFRATLNGRITPLARRVPGGGLEYDSGPFINGGDGYLYGAQRRGGPGGGGVIFRMKLLPTPIASSEPVSEPTMTAATLRASANNSLFYSWARFQYGIDQSYGSSTAMTSLPEDLEDQTFQASLTDLRPGTTYHYRAVLEADGKIYYSEDRQFTTAPNHLPIAGADVGLVRAGDSILLDVTANDQDEDDHAIALTAFTQGKFGAVVQEGNALRYTPGAGFAGSDSFSYTISDPFSSTTATVQIRNPLHAVQGLYETRLLDHRNATSGTLKMTLNPSGQFDGCIRVDGEALTFAGVLGMDGVWTQTIKTKRGKTAVIQLQLDTSSGTELLSGTVTLDGKSYYLSPETGSATADTALAYAGRHNAVLPPPDGSVPQGQGWITITVRPNGNVRLSGILGDGSPFTAGTRLRGDGRVPISVRLPAGQGDRIVGELKLAASPDKEISGSITWNKPARAKAPSYREGFEVVLNSVGSRYIIPARGEQSLSYSNPESAIAELRLLAGNLSEPTGGLLGVSKKDKITAPASRLQMTISRSTGLFRGTFRAEVSGTKQIGFSGVLLQSQNRGAGIYGRSGTAGKVTLQPQ